MKITVTDWKKQYNDDDLYNLYVMMILYDNNNNILITNTFLL